MIQNEMRYDNQGAQKIEYGKNCKKRVRVITCIGLLSIFWIATIQASATRLIVGSLLIGGGLTMLGKIDDAQLLDRASRVCNVSKEDLHAICATSIMLYGIGCLPIDHLGQPLRQFAFRAPFVAGLVGLVSSKAVKNVVSQIPGIGVYFGACANGECEGACNDCKVRTTVIALALWRHIVAPKLEAFETSRMGHWIGLS